MESWRRYIKEEFTERLPGGLGVDYPDEESAPFDSAEPTQKQLTQQISGADIFKPLIEFTKELAVIFEPTGQIYDLDIDTGKITTTYEELKSSAKQVDLAWEKGDYVTAGISSATAALLALAMIPFFGKIPKAAAAITSKARKISKSLKLSREPRFIKITRRIDEKLVELPKGSSVRYDIEKNRQYLSPDAPKPKDGYQSTYQQAQASEKRRLTKGEERVTSWRGAGMDWYVPKKPLSQYRFVKVKNSPLEFYHGGRPDLSIDNIQTIGRGHGSGAGFYAATDLETAQHFAAQSNSWAGKVHKIKLSPDAKVYKIPDEMSRELGTARDGLPFLHFDKASQESLSKAGIDALYNPIQGDIIVINKEIIDSVQLSKNNP